MALKTIWLVSIVEISQEENGRFSPSNRVLACANREKAQNTLRQLTIDKIGEWERQGLGFLPKGEIPDDFDRVSICTKDSRHYFSAAIGEIPIPNED